MALSLKLKKYVGILNLHRKQTLNPHPRGDLNLGKGNSMVFSVLCARECYERAQGENLVLIKDKIPPPPKKVQSQTST